MSTKNLESEFKVLKEEFSHVQSKIDILIEKYGELEKKYEKKKKKECCV